MRVTPVDIVRDALAKLGVKQSGEDISPDEQKDGLRALAIMVEGWSNQHLLIPSVTHQWFSLQKDQRIYSYGPCGDLDSPRAMAIHAAWVNTGDSMDYPLDVIGLHEYSRGTRNHGRRFGRPSVLYWEKGYPLTTFYLDAAPGEDTYTLTLKALLPFAEMLGECGAASFCPPTNIKTLAIDTGERECSGAIADEASITVSATRAGVVPPPLAANVSVDMPPGYLEALIYSLAVRLAPDYNLNAPAEVAAIASGALSNIKIQNTRVPTLRTDRELQGGSGDVVGYRPWYF